MFLNIFQICRFVSRSPYHSPDYRGDDNCSQLNPQVWWLYLELFTQHFKKCCIPLTKYRTLRVAYATEALYKINQSELCSSRAIELQIELTIVVHGVEPRWNVWLVLWQLCNNVLKKGTSYNLCTITRSCSKELTDRFFYDCLYLFHDRFHYKLEIICWVLFGLFWTKNPVAISTVILAWIYEGTSAEFSIKITGEIHEEILRQFPEGKNLKFRNS